MPDTPGTQGQEGQGQGGKDGKGKPSSTGRGKPTEADRLAQLHEAALTLEAWLKGVGQRVEGDASERVREVVEDVPVKEVVERMDRVGELILGGRRPEARDKAKEVATTLEVLARRLDVVHRGIETDHGQAEDHADQRTAGRGGIEIGS